SLDTVTFPTGMVRQVKKLTQFIKPSSPNNTTTEKIIHNTTDWMYNNMVILREHYTTVINNLLTQITNFGDLEWQVAVKWARNRYKQKLTDSNLTACKQIILDKQSQSLDTAGPSHATPLQKAATPQAQVHKKPPRHNTAHPISPSLSSTSSPSTVMTPNNPNNINSDHIFHSRTVTTSGENDGDTAETTARQKGIRMRGRREEKSSPPETRSESSLQSKPLAVAKPSRVSSDSSDEELLDRVPLRDTPYRHINTNRKASDWSISIHKPIVFIGDGNLNRIPSIKNTNIQIDSFPEANFLHLTKVLRKLSPHPHTQQVALAAGIHNRHQLPYKTAIKQLQGLWKAAYTAFPNATIHTALVPYSWSLPDQEQQNLEVLNEYIASHENPLMAESQDLFKVEQDGICWTTDTAQAIFDYWVEQLDP
ncbi:MAG: hypothetical protein ACRCVL_06060, partial [Cetobacterium sp.]